ncbi:helix-turn-helix domain-containing protein [Salana multivorans]
MAVHPRVATTLEDLGRNVRDWRKIHGLTAELLAQRAGISRETLRALEHGTGTVRLESLVAVLAALDLDRALVSATDPLTTEVGRARIDRLAAKRVRVRPW